MPNVISRRVRATIVALEKQWVLGNMSACICVAFVIQHAMRMLHFVICGLPSSTIFFHIIS